MQILALETSSTAGSVAVLRGDEVVRQTVLPAEQGSAQSLAPAVAATLAAAGWQPQDIQLIAVTQGPGSFTGLRVGAATAKALAYALGAELVGINTLEAIAAQALPRCAKVWTLLDAHRGQLFVARYQRGPEGQPEALEPTRIETIEAWLERYSPDEHVSGPGVSRIEARLPPGAAVIERALWMPQAATVGRLAARRSKQSRQDVWSFAPEYYRPSAAEEKYSQRK